MKCSKCKSDNIQRYQVIYEQGTSTIKIGSKTLGVGIGGGGLGVGTAGTKSKGTTQTLIAEKTEPPNNSAYESSAFILICFVGIGIALYKFLQNVDPYHIAVWICAIIGVIILVKSLNKDQEKHQKQYDEWLKKWYCNKCGNSFIGK